MHRKVHKIIITALSTLTENINAYAVAQYSMWVVYIAAVLGYAVRLCHTADRESPVTMVSCIRR